MMMNTTPNSIYGPVESWRLGKSLGVDLLCVDSICSFECVYCQLGKINRVTSERDVFVSTAKVLQDLAISDWRSTDVITFSGSGEPTLAKNLGDLIKYIKDITAKPIIVLTNSTLLEQTEVCDELALADKVFCKLDAWSDDTLRRIDRPHKGISLNSLVTGLEKFRKQYEGFMAIQTMLLRLPDESEIKSFADILRGIKPDEIQLNTPGRPIPRNYFVETRGNAVETAPGFTQLKTISKEDLESVRARLSELTDLPIITR